MFWLPAKRKYSSSPMAQLRGIKRNLYTLYGSGAVECRKLNLAAVSVYSGLIQAFPPQSPDTQGTDF